MSKRLFQILDEMNVNDEVNKTATLPCALEMVEAKSDKRGGLVTMGVEAEYIQKIFFGEYRPMLVLLNMKEYNRLEKQPVVGKLQEAEVKAARYEKALKEISGYSGLVPPKQGMIDIAREALTPKTTTNE